MVDVKERLRQDVDKATQYVRTLPNLNQDQFDALTSFAFNLGCGTFPSSSILHMLQARNFHGVGDTILKYDHAGGKKIPGLTHRRNAERALFCSSGDC